jgi:signal transduction histidine kinase
MTPDLILKFKSYRFTKPLVFFFSLAVILSLLVWALYNYRWPSIFYGPRAVYSMVVLSIALALLGRYLLLRMIQRESGMTRILYHRLPTSWQMLFLLDITAPIYLAASVLVGVSAAVLTALLTQTALQLFTYIRRFVSLTEASYRIASTALVALLTGDAFITIVGTQKGQVVDNFSKLTESNELLGCIFAALVMLLLLTLASLLSLIPYQSEGDSSSPQPGGFLSRVISRWRVFVASPALLFQAMVLSVGPLLPVVDIFDNSRAEVAWLFFLVPLCAIYYLALASTRLRIRTDTLQETLTDLNSARRRQDELRDYATLITRVQEEERRRLARELHDDTAQALIALALGLDGLGRAIGKLDLTERDKQWLESLQNLADHTLEGVRRACRDLRPSVLDDLGLRAALEWLSDSSSERGVPCNFSCRGVTIPTTSENEIAVFRITQEALSNIWRHAGATQASIELAYLPEQLCLTIRDNGRGFVPDDNLDAAHNSQGGLGLLGMRERAALIGATLEITSSPGNGCLVQLSLPIVAPHLSNKQLPVNTL